MSSLITRVAESSESRGLGVGWTKADGLATQDGRVHPLPAVC